MIHRVKDHQTSNCIVLQFFQTVKERSQVSPKGENDRINMLYIPKKDIKCAQKEGDS